LILEEQNELFAIFNKFYKIVRKVSADGDASETLSQREKVAIIKALENSLPDEFCYSPSDSYRALCNNVDYPVPWYGKCY